MDQDDLFADETRQDDTDDKDDTDDTDDEVRRSMLIDQDARDLAIAIARIADDKKGDDVIIMHVGDVLSLTEYFVVASASNRRLVSTLVEEIEAQIRATTGRSPLRVEGAREQQWVLIDYGDVIAHVFLAEIRDFYEIERLYVDVPRVEWERPAGTPVTRTDGTAGDAADDTD